MHLSIYFIFKHKSNFFFSIIFSTFEAAMISIFNGQRVIQDCLVFLLLVLLLGQAYGGASTSGNLDWFGCEQRVVSGSNTVLSVSLSPISASNFLRGKLEFLTEDGVVGYRANIFVPDISNTGFYTATQNFYTNAPKGVVYYAKLTVENKSGKSQVYTSTDLQNLYSESTYTQSSYAITYMENQTAIDNMPPMELTYFNVSNTVISAKTTQSIQFISGFKTPVGGSANFYVCTEEGCPEGQYLCHGSDGLPNYLHIESKQIQGGFTAGMYQTECTLNTGVPAGKYYFLILMVDNAGGEVWYKTDQLQQLGFQTYITVNA